MTTAMVEKQPDLDALEADAMRQVSELTQKLDRVAPEAFTDVQIEQEVLDLESQLRAAEAELQRVARARAESGRREAEAEEKADREVKAQALAEFQSLGASLMGEADKLQAELKAVARRLPKLDALKAKCDDALERSGATVNRMALRQIRPENALLGELRAAGSERLFGWEPRSLDRVPEQVAGLYPATDPGTSNGGGQGEA